MANETTISQHNMFPNSLLHTLVFPMLAITKEELLVVGSVVESKEMLKQIWVRHQSAKEMFACWVNSNYSSIN